MKNKNFIVKMNNGKIVYVHSVMNTQEAAIVAQAFMIKQGMTYDLDFKNIKEVYDRESWKTIGIKIDYIA